MIFYWFSILLVQQQKKATCKGGLFGFAIDTDLN